MIPDWLTTKPIAHRGLHKNNAVVPENSFIAFSAAIDRGIPIELDVHVIADGTVIVFHDDDLERMCGLQRSTQSLTLGELPNFYLKRSNETIPTLEAVLSLVGGRVPILIEIKHIKNVPNAAENIQKILLQYPYEIAVQSFNPLTLGWFKKHAPNILRGQLASNFRDHKISFLKKFLLRNYYFNFISKPDFIAHDIGDLPSRRIAYLRESGIPVLGWTIKNVEESQFAYYYCDNIIFEGEITN